MGKIKKILENELVGGTQSTDVYPVTSVKAVYDENNERLDHILNRRGVVNISTNYNNDHIAEVLTLAQAITKVPASDRVLGFQGTFLSEDGWQSYMFTGESITDWNDVSKWSRYYTKEEADEYGEYQNERLSLLESISSIKDPIVFESKKPQGYIQNYYINSSGNFVSQNAQKVSYWQVNKGDIIKVTGTSNLNSKYSVWSFFSVIPSVTASPKIYKPWSGEYYDNYITAPFDGYIALSHGASYVQGIGIATITSYDELHSSMQETITDLSNSALTKLTYNNALVNTGMYKDGSLISGSSGYHSDYIPISDILVGISMTYFAQSAYNPLSFFDQNKQYISCIEDSGGVTKTRNFLKSSFPANTAFVVVSSTNQYYGLINGSNIYNKLSTFYNKLSTLNDKVDAKYSIKDVMYTGRGHTYDYTVLHKAELLQGNYILSVGDIACPEGADSAVYIRAFTGTSNKAIAFCGANRKTTFSIEEGIDYIEVRFYAGVTVSSQLDYNYSVSYINFQKLQGSWGGAVGAGYGDSIVAQCNGDYIGTFNDTWLPMAANKLLFKELYCRGVGGQTYKWNDSAYYCKAGGTGNYVNRYKAVNGQISQSNGVVTVSTTEKEKQAIEGVLGYQIEIHRGCFCSWDRITSMFPESIKNSIEIIYIMGGTNDFSGVEEIESSGTDGSLKPTWSASNQTDEDWKNAGDYYNGGDFDVNNTWGGMASCLMKMQVWMPQAKIVVLVPITRKGNNYNNPTNSSGATYKDLSDSIKAVADWCNTEVIDMMSCGITQFNVDDALSDGVHPKAGQGWSRMGLHIAVKTDSIARFA